MDTQPNIFERYDADKLCEQVRRHPGAPHLTKKYNLEDIELLRTDIRLFIRNFIDKDWCTIQRKITSTVAVLYMAWLHRIYTAHIKNFAPKWIWHDFEEWYAFIGNESAAEKTKTQNEARIHESLINKAKRIHAIVGIDCGYSGGDFTTVIYDDEVDALRYVLPNDFYKLPQETAMSSTTIQIPLFTKKVLINGNSADTMSDNEIIDSIHKAQDDIAYLKSIETSSKKITKRIEKLTKQINQTVAYLDAR